ncbi:MAG: hypothetical protein AB1451_10850 [Nitrospirota bacterium]
MQITTKAGLIAVRWAMLAVMLAATPVAAHEIVGQVTPLMIHMKRALLLAENGKAQEAVAEARAVYEDFAHEMGMGMTMEGAGLKSTAAQIDRTFGTRLGESLEQSLQRNDADTLKKTIQELALLLMIEKFNALQASFGKDTVTLDTQRTMFWLGRNYFSYLLEPTLAAKDPIEEQRLDRMLDVMLYRLEDGEHQSFLDARRNLLGGITTAFRLTLPQQASAGIPRG